MARHTSNCFSVDGFWACGPSCTYERDAAVEKVEERLASLETLARRAADVIDTLLRNFNYEFAPEQYDDFAHVRDEIRARVTEAKGDRS